MNTAILKINRSKQSGFTLIELLIVIGILAVLMGIVLVAINPAKQFQQANNTKRESDVTEMLNAVNQYMADNKGAVPTGITTNATEIGSASGDADLCALLAPRYIAALPVDPSVGNGNQVSDCSNYDTGYTIIETGSANDDRITVSAPHAEGGASISVTR